MLQWDKYEGHVKDECIYGTIFTLGWCLGELKKSLIWDASSIINGKVLCLYKVHCNADLYMRIHYDHSSDQFIGI